MAKKEDKKRELAEDLYIRLGMSGREIADYIDISEQTISRWKKGKEGERSWDERKLEVTLTPLKVKELLLIEANKIASGETSTIDADKLSKLVSAIDKLDKRISVRVMVDVFMEFDNWVVEINPQMAIEFTKFHKLFLQHQIAIS